MSWTLGHPYRDPGPVLLPPERPLERASSRWRRGGLAVSLIAHVSLVLLVMRCSEIEQLEAAPRHGNELQPPGVATQVALRQLARVASYPELDRPICGGFPPDPPESTESGASAAPTGPPPTLTIAPSVLRRLLVSGDAAIQPSAPVRLLMLRDGVTRIDAVVKLCIGTDGAVRSVTLLRSTKYADYDSALVSEVRGWRYRPYQRDGVAQTVCSTVTIRH